MLYGKKPNLELKHIFYQTSESLASLNNPTNRETFDTKKLWKRKTEDRYFKTNTHTYINIRSRSFSLFRINHFNLAFHRKKGSPLISPCLKTACSFKSEKASVSFSWWNPAAGFQPFLLWRGDEIKIQKKNGGKSKWRC